MALAAQSQTRQCGNVQEIKEAQTCPLKRACCAHQTSTKSTWREDCSCDEAMGSAGSWPDSPGMMEAAGELGGGGGGMPAEGSPQESISHCGVRELEPP